MLPEQIWNMLRYPHPMSLSQKRDVMPTIGYNQPEETDGALPAWLCRTYVRPDDL